MPYTLILFVSRKPGLSPSAFKHHWETTYIPLLKSLVGHDFPLSYTRHYIDRDSNAEHPDSNSSLANIFIGKQEDFLFDAIAVFTFANKPHWERFLVKVKQPDAAMKLTEDDDKFQDYERLKGVFVGDTRSTGRDGGEVGWRFVGSF